MHSVELQHSSSLTNNNSLRQSHNAVYAKRILTWKWTCPRNSLAGIHFAFFVSLLKKTKRWLLVLTSSVLSAWSSLRMCLQLTLRQTLRLFRFLKRFNKQCSFSRCKSLRHKGCLTCLKAICQWLPTNSIINNRHWVRIRHLHDSHSCHNSNNMTLGRFHKYLKTWNSKYWTNRHRQCVLLLFSRSSPIWGQLLILG
jgi:hypothetical protein